MFRNVGKARLAPLKVDWVNSMDIMVDKIKVSWEADGMQKHDTLLTSDI